MNKNETKRLTIRERASLFSAGLLGRRTDESKKLFEVPPRATAAIINDCREPNARARQEARINSLLDLQTVFVGITSDIDAAGNLVDQLDALEGTDRKTNQKSKNVILVNVAPRNGKAKKWENGTPFGYFWHGNTLVLSSIDGHTLSLVKKLGLTKQVHVIDTPGALELLVGSKEISPSERVRIENTQFRSYEFLPRVAKYVLQHSHIRSHPISIEEISTIENDRLWEVDIFGNCKLTTLEGESIGDNAIIGLQRIAKLPRYPRLKDVPDGVLAVVGGSSGFKDKRFLEVVQQGGNASQKLFGLGDTISVRL